MARVIIKQDSNNSEQFNIGLKKFTSIYSDVKKVAKRHTYFLRPGLKAKDKSKDAFKVYSKAQKNIKK